MSKPKFSVRYAVLDVDDSIMVGGVLESLLVSFFTVRPALRDSSGELLAPAISHLAIADN